MRGWARRRLHRPEMNSSPALTSGAAVALLSARRRRFTWRQFVRMRCGRNDFSSNLDRFGEPSMRRSRSSVFDEVRLLRTVLLNF